MRNKKNKTDVLRGDRIRDRMVTQEVEVWIDRFFERVAPWVDRDKDLGDQILTGGALWSFLCGRVAVMGMAEGRSARDAWEGALFSLEHLAAESKAVVAGKKPKTARKPIPQHLLASSIRALTSPSVIQMVESESPAFAATFWHSNDEFSLFISNWSFRAGALVTFALAEGKESGWVIDQVVEDAFIASGGQFTIAPGAARPRDQRARWRRARKMSDAPEISDPTKQPKGK